MLRDVAAVSLLVGWIGIGQCARVGIERTREIRIQLAIGASEPQVLLQFLIKAWCTSGAGSLVGIAVGIGGSRRSAMGWPFVLTPFWILVAFGISMAIGVIFGFYPARKAAQMNPIDALRFE
jgi:putative ABC transport system permease protein